jgi:outer membrane receptor for monomeric catechols
MTSVQTRSRVRIGTPLARAQATTPFDPEEVKNYEVGIKSTLWDRRLRINADVLYMDYTDLQVIQTNAACLCNQTSNAASAEIKGVEAERPPTTSQRNLRTACSTDASRSVPRTVTGPWPCGPRT